MFLVEQTMSSISSLMHLVGDRPFAAIGDRSRNLGWLALSQLGRRVAAQPSPLPILRCRLAPADPGLWAIRALAALGLAWDVKTPPPERVAASRALSVQPAESD